MELVYNNDEIFFSIVIDFYPGNPADNWNIIAEHLISFSVSEEVSKMTTGNITLHDPQNMYARLLPYGTTFTLTWGYKKWNPSLNTIFDGEQFPFRSYRTGLKCTAVTPEGGGDENGQLTYSIGFYASQITGQFQSAYRVFNTGTRGTLVALLMNELGVLIPDVRFTGDTEAFTVENQEVQRGSAYKTLLYLANKWDCIFIISNDTFGNTIGLFVDSKNYNGNEVKSFYAKIGAMKYRIKTLYYNSGSVSNVKSYSWQNHVGDSGQGVQLKINQVDGSVIVQRYKADTKTVVTYKLNPDRIAQRLQDADKQNQFYETLASTSFLSATEFNQVSWAFDAEPETTAPQGMGYTINVSMVGDPWITSPMEIKFGNGFPVELQVDQNNIPNFGFWVLRATHSISKGNYTLQLQVVDSYTYNGSYLQDTKAPSVYSYGDI